MAVALLVTKGETKYMRLPVTGNKSSLYFANLSVGTPPVTYQLQVDTGSSLTAFPCVNCQNCYEIEDQKLYNPQTSLTGSIVKCVLNLSFSAIGIQSVVTNASNKVKKIVNFRRYMETCLLSLETSLRITSFSKGQSSLLWHMLAAFLPIKPRGKK